MVIVKVNATIAEDNTGIRSQIPILLTEQGELTSVTDYLLHLEVEGKSIGTLNRICRAVAKLIDYMDANTGLFTEPAKLFQSFVKRLYSGTISEDGLDPSGLYWIPISVSETNHIISALNGFTDWVSTQSTFQSFSLNSLREATPHEQRLNYAAWYRKNQNNFLGHIKDKSMPSAVRKARTIKGRTPLVKVDDDAIAFPEQYWEAFYLHGMGATKDLRVALRDKLILLLMHGGGLRISEALLLWVTDVFEDPVDPAKALVRIYSEEVGKAPNGWKSRNKVDKRPAYLKEQYGRIPRKKMIGTQRLGFKSTYFDHKDGYMQVQWFPTNYGRVFMVLWKTYLHYRAAIDCHHPYAFISFSDNSLSEPYTQNAFNSNYRSGLARIDLKPNKAEGLAPHGHRHNYGRRLTDANVNPLIIKKCMHHVSLDSQEPYTQLGHKIVSQKLEEATKQLEFGKSNVKSLDWKSLLEHGFKDIDPRGQFTGKNPKLGSKK